MNKSLLVAFIDISLVVPTSLIFKNTTIPTAQAQKNKINDTSLVNKYFKGEPCNTNKQKDKAKAQRPKKEIKNCICIVQSNII